MAHVEAGHCWGGSVTPSNHWNTYCSLAHALRQWRHDCQPTNLPQAVPHVISTLEHLHLWESSLLCVLNVDENWQYGRTCCCFIYKCFYVTRPTSSVPSLTLVIVLHTECVLRNKWCFQSSKMLHLCDAQEIWWAPQYNTTTAMLSKVYCHKKHLVLKNKLLYSHQSTSCLSFSKTSANL